MIHKINLQKVCVVNISYETKKVNDVQYWPGIKFLGITIDRPCYTFNTWGQWSTLEEFEKECKQRLDRNGYFLNKEEMCIYEYPYIKVFFGVPSRENALKIHYHQKGEKFNRDIQKINEVLGENYIEYYL